MATLRDEGVTDDCSRPSYVVPFGRANGSEAKLRRGPVGGRLSGTALAATNDLSAGSVCKRRDAVTLGRKKGLQPRANKRPADSFSFKLAGALRYVTDSPTVSTWASAGRQNSRTRDTPRQLRECIQLAPPKEPFALQHNPLENVRIGSVTW